MIDRRTLPAFARAAGVRDDIAQIRDELRVVWLALTSPHAAEYVEQIGEHVNSLFNRLDDASQRLNAEDAP